jgi:hypothetical protein
MLVDIDDELITTGNFWLVNILVHLDNEKIRQLTKELAERCGLIVADKNDFHPAT